MFPGRRNRVLLAGILLLVVVLGSGATRDKTEIARELLELLHSRRHQAGLPALQERSALESAASHRARDIALRAPELRLSQDVPIEDLLEEEGIVRYHQVKEHVELQQGYPDAANSALKRWQAQESTWAMMMDPGMDAVGLAAVVGEDGWLVLVTLVLEDLDIPADLGAWETRVIEEINKERAEQGLPLQFVSAALSRVARLHSEDMARRDYFAHASPEGHDLGRRIQGRDIQYARLAENIGRNRGADDPVLQAIEGWMKSPPHRKNILTHGFIETGVGIAVDEKGMFYFTQLFVDPGGR